MKKQGLAENLILWVHEHCSKVPCVCQPIVMFKAKSSLTIQSKAHFLQVGGFLEKFMKHNGLLCRQKTTNQQKNPSILIDKIVTYNACSPFKNAVVLKHLKISGI